MKNLYISAQDKAEILLETMPWLEKYSGKRVVIKYGGNAMVNDELKQAFATDILFLHQWGIQPVIVHGGGPQINTMLKELGLEGTFRSGFRVTSPEVMKVVRMVLTGSVQRELVSALNAHSIHAVGLSGEDGGLFSAKRKTATVDGEKVDIGLVGEIASVRAAPVEELLSSGRIPVISSVALDMDDPGQVLNVNADEAAGALAAALDAQKLIILTDVAGLYRNWPEQDSLINQIHAAELSQMLPKLESGMVPKMEACLRAINGGVPQAHIIDGRQAHSMLLEIFTNAGVGTMVIPDEEGQN